MIAGWAGVCNTPGTPGLLQYCWVFYRGLLFLEPCAGCQQKDIACEVEEI